MASTFHVHGYRITVAKGNARASVWLGDRCVHETTGYVQGPAVIEKGLDGNDRVIKPEVRVTSEVAALRWAKGHPPNRLPDAATEPPAADDSDKDTEDDTEIEESD